jgi:phospholipid/cholesterol/gamma-HCH transport system ATP-binding protein
MLFKGRMVWQGAAADLMQSDNPMVDQFTHGLRCLIQMELRR